MPIISVIVPVFNVEKYLRQCLDSLVNQTLKDIEIILIDDASPDNSGKICDEYARLDKRVIVIHQENNMGVSAGRNIGIDIAKGEWIAFIDADDWIDITAFEILYNEVTKSNCDMLFFDSYTEYENKQERYRAFTQAFTSTNREDIKNIQLSRLLYRGKSRIEGGLGSPWGKLYRGRILKEFSEIRFPLHHHLYEDACFNLIFFEYISSFQYIDHMLYHYRIHSNSVTRSYSKDALLIKAQPGVLWMIEYVAKYHFGDEEYEQALYARCLLDIIWAMGVDYFHNDNIGVLSWKIKNLKNAFDLDPYKTAIKKLNYHTLHLRHKIFLFFVRRKWTFVLLILHKSNEFVKNL